MMLYFILLSLVILQQLCFNYALVTPNSPLSPVHTLLLCRHGDSIWNGGEPGTRETFTGWTDVPLSRKGIQEALNTGEQVSSQYYSPFGIDACFTSILQRAQLTAHYTMWAFCEKPSHESPRRYVQDYRLNERHYGALQGLVKQDVERGLYGHDPAIVQEWRRSWYTTPPLLDDNDPRRLQDIKKYSNYCGGPEQVPRGESLQQVANNRVRPFLDQVVTPMLNEAASQRPRGHGGTGLVVAHANSLRALIGVICDIEKEPKALEKLEALRLPTGVPLALKYVQLHDGSYQVCDLSGSAVIQLSSRDLPVFPLSCVPKTKTATARRASTEKEEVKETLVVDEVEVREEVAIRI